MMSYKEIPSAQDTLQDSEARTETGGKVYGRTIQLEWWMSGPGKIASDVFPGEMPDSAALGQRMTRRTRRTRHTQRQAAIPKRRPRR